MEPYATGTLRSDASDRKQPLSFPVITEKVLIREFLVLSCFFPLNSQLALSVFR
jgi:hypothetical protein